jgi:hypothetical protein
MVCDSRGTKSTDRTKNLAWATGTLKLRAVGPIGESYVNYTVTPKPPSAAEEETPIPTWTPTQPPANTPPSETPPPEPTATPMEEPTEEEGE